MINKRSLINIYHLAIKEMYSLRSDLVLVLMLILMFTGIIIVINNTIRLELNQAKVAVIDLDQSALSYQIKNNIIKPNFLTPIETDRNSAYQALERGEFVFVLEFPPNFQRDIVNLRPTQLQLLIDATAMTQAGLGQSYLQQIITEQIISFLDKNNINNTINNIKVHSQFNNNNDSARISTINQLIMNITLFAIVLVGAAVIRENEKGTIEHLLVMPIKAYEVAIAKILTSSLFIILAALICIYFIIHLYLGVPINGSLWLFTLATSIYLFAITALGILIATLAANLPQFGLIVCPLILLTNLTTGAVTPISNMPTNIQYLVQMQPTTHFVSVVQDIVFRGSSFNHIAWRLAIMLAMGLVFFTIALMRFKSMLEKQG